MLRVYMGEGKVERAEKWNEWNDGTSETRLLISVIPDIHMFLKCKVYTYTQGDY